MRTLAEIQIAAEALPPEQKQELMRFIAGNLKAEPIPVQLGKLTRAQKLQVMESLWGDLCADPAKLESPSWHEEALEETEKAIQEGTVQFTDWELVKKKLRDLAG